MKVLIACEESQVECQAFRSLGHDAYSCDVQPCSGGHPEWHIQDDVLNHLEGWDLIIAHPPCTYLCAASAVRLFNADHTIKNVTRYIEGIAAKNFFLTLWNAPCKYICVENPRPLKIWGLPKANCIVQPYQHGDPWRKETHLWLKNLPILEPTNIVEPLGLWVGTTSARRDSKIHSKYKLSSHRDQKTRSRSFTGIATAMAVQWTNYITQQ